MNAENKINNISNPKQPILPPEGRSDLLNIVDQESSMFPS